MGTTSYTTITRRTLFGIAAAILVLYVAATAIIGEIDPESLMFVGPVILIPFFTGLAMRRWAGKTSLFAVLVGILLIIFNAPFKDIGNPTATIDFTFQAVGVFGGIIVIITGVLGFIDRNSEIPGPPAPMLQYGLAALVVIPAVAALGGIIGWVAGSSDVTDADRAAAVSLEMSNFQFEQDSVTATSSNIVVSNNDLFHHYFTVEDLDIDVSINPGREALIDISDAAPGEYDITCSIQGHEEMESKLVVR